MTNEQLKAIRQNVDFNDVSIHDVIPLLAEVERLTAEVEMLRGVGCMEDGDGPCGACRKCAFQRGVNAAADACRPEYPDAVRRLRALPDPEDEGSK